MNLFRKFWDWKKRIEDPLYDLDDWEQVDALIDRFLDVVL